MADLTDAFKAAHPTLTTPYMVATFFWGSGNNGTFVINSSDRIADQHGRPNGTAIPGFMDAFKPEAHARGFGYVLPQDYRCGPDVVQHYTITTKYTNGVPTIKKSGP
jgi:hypothetical protein